MDQHTHGPDGAVIFAEPIDAIPAVAEAEAVETAAGASVAIAEIEAARDVKLAQTDVKRAETYASEELAELRGEVRAMREIVDALKPPEAAPPAPVAPPVIIEDDAPQADPPPPAEVENKPEVAKKKSSGFWW